MGRATLVSQRRATPIGAWRPARWRAGQPSSAMSHSRDGLVRRETIWGCESPRDLGVPGEERGWGFAAGDLASPLRPRGCVMASSLHGAGVRLPVRKGTLRIFKWPSSGGVGRQGRCDVQEVRPTARRAKFCAIGRRRPIRTRKSGPLTPVESRELLGVEYEVQRSTEHKYLVVCVVQPLPGPPRSMRAPRYFRAGVSDSRGGRHRRPQRLA